MLPPLLADLGLTSLITDADLSGIGPHITGTMDQVWQEAFVEIHELGTEAGAATGGDVTDSASPVEPTSFVADHPFLFFLYDQDSGAVLFMGRVADPTTE